jgi:IS30 family transposase
LRLEVTGEGVFGKSRSKLAREIRRRREIAEQYEAAYAAAREGCGIRTALDAREKAADKVVKLGGLISKIPAQTLAGVQIKARTITACEKIPYWVRGISAGQCFGPGLAADINRVMSIGKAVQS